MLASEHTHTRAQLAAGHERNSPAATTATAVVAAAKRAVGPERYLELCFGGRWPQTRWVRVYVTIDKVIRSYACVRTLLWRWRRVRRLQQQQQYHRS